MLEIDTSNYGVYEVTRNDTGEVIYVGCSWKGIKERFKRHIRDLKGNYHSNSGLQKLWNAKGLTFTHVVKCLPIEDLCLAFEKAYGAQYDFKKLVNVNPLGLKAPDRTGMKISQEHKDQISKKLRGKKRPEHSKILTGRKRPDQSERMKGECNPMLDKKHKEKLKGPRPSIQGENHPHAKITTVVARTIKFLLFYTTLTHQEIADGIPGVTKAIVDNISMGNSWKDVELHNQRFYNV
jgi:group I intron endonuclease